MSATAGGASNICGGLLRLRYRVVRIEFWIQVSLGRVLETEEVLRLEIEYIFEIKIYF